ncbi:MULTISPECIES: FAD-dependent monooxygenase [unclassified Bradyrhizobium]|uniref:FAD-dependent monooxygenase n=1 Tax=unclassified Bradyrhizobium TaxID=2631580 RepID=UPI0024790664|nr:MULTISPECIES: FAD-dependent monooxygenase [unclassified Bradyrhizobium]WGR74216.1 FAD-dependent monooxygenase [Bradyrhizobium sp. ISRA426]WGR79051.1 FAD-dependent monooxygenase [Bradyrhizobium sp. ISRA430]WGR89455.1 FAD-dependent monooxygenase [Bradyrhizobium sp. ISRA432]
MARSRTIAIAGAGIGGLTAALALAARGFRVVVLEKAERLEEVGAGLQLSPNASRVLVELGLEDRLKLRAVTPDAVCVMSARAGGELLRMPLGEVASTRAGAPYWVVHRADLQSALAGAVSDHPDIELKLGATFEDVAPHAKGLTIVHRSGTIRRNDLASALIGADGVWSTVRKQLFPDVQPRFSGLIAWRGTFEATQLPREYTARRVQLWMGPNAHLVAYPIAGGRQINVVAVLPGTWNRPGWSTPGDPSEVMDAFAAPRWPPSARMMLGAVDSWRKWALFTLPEGCGWSKGPIALLGDAVHAMLPFAAQGAGMAIEDAAVLAQHLTGEAAESAAGIAAALKQYGRARQARVRRVQRTARQQGRIYHFTGPLAIARDLAIRALGPERMLARQDWIYGWRH